MLTLVLLAAVPGPCSLLTAAEIQSVQKEQPELAKESSRPAGDLVVGQCFYQLPTFAKSISLELTSGPGVKAYWKKAFHEAHPDEKEEEAKERPERLKGLGEEAFWTGSVRLGGLYVLAKGSILRLSIGGADAKDTKLKKLRALARAALKRL